MLISFQAAAEFRSVILMEPHHVEMLCADIMAVF